MNKFKKTLLICVLVLGLILIFINPIQLAIITYLSERINTTEYSTEEIKQNEVANADFEFDAVQSLSIAEVLKAQASIDSLPVIGSIVVPIVNMQLPIFKSVGNTALAVGAGA